MLSLLLAANGKEITNLPRVQKNGTKLIPKCPDSPKIISLKSLINASLDASDISVRIS